MDASSTGGFDGRLYQPNCLSLRSASESRGCAKHLPQRRSVLLVGQGSILSCAAPKA